MSNYKNVLKYFLNIWFQYLLLHHIWSMINDDVIFEIGYLIFRHMAIPIHPRTCVDQTDATMPTTFQFHGASKSTNIQWHTLSYTYTQLTYNRLDLSFSIPKVFWRSPSYQPMQTYKLICWYLGSQAGVISVQPLPC